MISPAEHEAMPAGDDQTLCAAYGRAYERALCGWFDDIDLLQETLVSYALLEDDPAAPMIAPCLLDDLFDTWRQLIGDTGGDCPDGVATDDRSYVDRYPDELREALALTLARLHPREPELLRFWQEIVQSVLLGRLHAADHRRGERRASS